MASVKSSDYAERIQSGLRSANSFSAPFPWFLTISGALEYEIPVVFFAFVAKFTVRHKTISIYKWTVKKSASIYDLLVHQYGGVVTVAKFLSRDWKPSIEQCSSRIITPKLGAYLVLIISKVHKLRISIKIETFYVREYR